MVTSTLQPPKRPATDPFREVMDLIGTPRYAVFTDTRGVVYCEQVDRAKVVFGCVGKTMGGAPNYYRGLIAFKGDKEATHNEVRSFLERGFVIERDAHYLVENHWGIVKPLKIITDLPLGKRLSRVLRNASPEGYYDGQPDNIAQLNPPHREPVQPLTRLILAKIAGKYMNKRAIAATFHSNGMTVSPEHQAWFDKWMKKAA